MVCYFRFFDGTWAAQWFNLIDTDSAYQHVNLLPNESVRLFL